MNATHEGQDAADVLERAADEMEREQAEAMRAKAVEIAHMPVGA